MKNLGQAIESIEAARRGMMSWMREFRPEEFTGDELTSYLEKKASDVQTVKDNMLDALEKEEKMRKNNPISTSWSYRRDTNNEISGEFVLILKAYQLIPAPPVNRADFEVRISPFQIPVNALIIFGMVGSMIVDKNTSS